MIRQQGCLIVCCQKYWEYDENANNRKGKSNQLDRRLTGNKLSSYFYTSFFAGGVPGVLLRNGGNAAFRKMGIILRAVAAWLSYEWEFVGVHVLHHKRNGCQLSGDERTV
jgi:hypothetical protein